MRVRDLTGEPPTKTSYVDPNPTGCGNCRKMNCVFAVAEGYPIIGCTSHEPPMVDTICEICKQDNYRIDPSYKYQYMDPNPTDCLVCSSQKSVCATDEGYPIESCPAQVRTVCTVCKAWGNRFDPSEPDPTDPRNFGYSDPNPSDCITCGTSKSVCALEEGYPLKTCPPKVQTRCFWCETNGYRIEDSGLPF